jgi:hypothetical protein
MTSKLRVLFCLCLVFALHIAVLFTLHIPNNFLEKVVHAPNYLQYVSITLDEPIKAASKLSSAPKSNKTVKTDLPTNVSPTESIAITPHDSPKLNLDTWRTTAAQQELKRTRSPIEQQQENNHRNQSIEAQIERSAKQAARSDCRKAYAQTGLLAPLFIASDLLSDKGCKF